MKKRRKKKPGRTSSQLANWQKARRLLASVGTKKPLNATDRMTALKIIGQALSGEDARKDLGVNPKRGRPAENLSLRNLQIAEEYFLLENAGMAPKKATARVAKNRRLGASTVEKIVIANRWLKTHAGAISFTKDGI